MALMLGSLYDALISGGTTDEKARKAAEEVAGYENRLVSIEARLTSIEARLAMLTWMVGLTFASVVALLLKAFV